MTVTSMTGFARAQGQNDSQTWTWEAKSVNSKGLDVRMKLAPGFEGLEPAVRKAVGGGLRRGNIYLMLEVRRGGDSGGVRVNMAVLERMLEAAEQLRQKVPDLAPPTVDGLLGLRGVMDMEEETVPDEAARAATERAILETLDQALKALAAMRAEEGSHLHQNLTDHLAVIADLCGRAESLAATQPDAIKARLAEQVQDLMDTVPALPEERLAQEAALLMTKADIREELDRLKAHIAATRALLASGEPVGRKLDFLCQEFNREANTLCSKSIDTDLTQVGLDLKAVVEQFREQVQNVE
ncbi:conserved hypothetical protein [Magnetospira sp. QH-2]|nr:YicC/YloC family endoribonuclease [Magnetospira sp. QH-2]CCQ74418.1 conserved hypothetical protein [Magnetospira sp. QH-2]